MKLLVVLNCYSSRLWRNRFQDVIRNERELGIKHWWEKVIRKSREMSTVTKVWILQRREGKEGRREDTEGSTVLRRFWESLQGPWAKVTHQMNPVPSQVVSWPSYPDHALIDWKQPLESMTSFKHSDTSLSMAGKFMDKSYSPVSDIWEAHYPEHHKNPHGIDINLTAEDNCA